ncbi:MAG: EAL domain-containing protein [Treponema sp.]|uniref:EAL domain-containing protein n=1 Tax=Treponema sp. TaxID=166 RepID=UPI001B3D3939|nr:EAL domain-containing protein [Treponema sp.]MBP5402781.1 EAL domain-containing protein [Treponema sp.]MBR5934044.1 EAL domain-containing protein [Treponema sp.]
MNKRTVLIVDQDQINRSVLAKILQEDYILILAVNETEALRILKTNYKRISAIILDLEMPDTQAGYKVLEKIHADKNYSKIPIVVSSQIGSEEEEETALSLGAHDFIFKPYKPQIIKHRLSNTIELMEAVKVVNLVIKDDLTPCYNKSYFMTKVREILTERAEEKFDILCIDIEQFKMVNDSYGIATGDKILYKLGEILLSEIPDEAVCSRFTADEFFIELPQNEESYEPFIERVSAALHKYLPRLGVKIKLKICCGAYYIHDKLIPIAAMCDRAQLATENIKGKYGQFVAYYKDDIRRQMHNIQAITNVMEHALKNNEFKVYYQPKYELASECVAGAEALVRWENKDLGFMTPAAFIPLFEKNGFITSLDMFVWERVCQDMQEWMSQGGKPFAVSLNVSRADIYNPKLIKYLLDLSDKYQIDRKYLHLEITESAYTDNPEQIIKVVTDLREKGFPIEMDDFGSGYSSLNMLSEIPIDILKLDMGFVKNELEKPSGKGILGFVISLAKWLNLAVVAEGVETPEQIKILSSMECNYVQGFYFEKPLCKEDFFKLMKDGDVKEMYLTSSENYMNKDKLLLNRAIGKKTGTILIVDDIELSREVIKEIFISEYDIVEAVDGLQAWNYLKENSDEITVVLMDLLMPVMDGYQLLKKIRANPQTKNIPVVVTSQGDEKSEERALSMSAEDFISKPYNPTILKHRVRNAVINSKVKKLEVEKQLNKDLLEAELAVNKDALTGLSTRKVLESKVNDFFANSENKNAVFVMIDVDNFKEVNDTYGHIKGDETLKKVGEVLQASFRDEDVLCRMGGDEFAIFIPKKFEKKQLESKLTRLCTNLSFFIEKINVTCSIGACLSPKYGQDYQTLYNNADMALLASKRYGKNQYQIFTGQAVLPSYIFYRNMDWLLDEFNDAVVVCSRDTYELLYINKNACEIAGKEKRDCMGKKCFEALWGRKTPCPHCPEVLEPSNEFKEIKTVINGDNYSMRIKQISWGGAPARVQYIKKENASLIDKLMNPDETQ